MDRWTMRELKDTDDITFAIQILYERRRGLTPYSQLGMKLAEAARTLSEIKAERDRYHERLCAVCGPSKGTDERENSEDNVEDSTDFSGCDEETKAQILDNAAKLEELQCNPCEPTSPECDECEFGGAVVGE